MQYRTMPGSEEKLSVLGYGCMRFPTKVGGVASSLIDKERTIKQVRAAIDRGINYLDTAYFYHAGASESFLGEYILKDGYREKVKIATKLPCMGIRKKESIEQIFNKQLEKLQVEYIDYYLLHALNGKTWELMKEFGIIEFMDKIKASGKVKHMGFSFHGTKEEFKRICDEYDFEFTQIQFNLLDENFQAGLEGMNYAHSKGMGIIIMEPLRGGSLVGKMPSEIQKIYDGSGYDRSPADWALRWVWNHPAVTVVLSGMNLEEHIEENIRVACEALPDGMSKEELEIINDVRDTYLRLMKVGCTGCAYCMPCPAGIDIPNTFKSLNNYHMFSRFSSRAMYAVGLSTQIKNGKIPYTNTCLNCSKCEEACPQNIPIRETFKQVQKDLEGPSTRAMTSIGKKMTTARKKKSK